MLGGYSQHMQHESCTVEDSNHIAVKKLAVLSLLSGRNNAKAATMSRNELAGWPYE